MSDSARERAEWGESDGTLGKAHHKITSSGLDNSWILGDNRSYRTGGNARGSPLLAHSLGGSTGRDSARIEESRRENEKEIDGKRLRKHGDWKGLRERQEEKEKRQLSEEFELFPSTVLAGWGKLSSCSMMGIEGK